MNKALFVFVFALISGCGTNETAVPFQPTEDTLFLKLCDEQGACRDPGQLVLLDGPGDSPGHPFHWNTDLSMQDAMDNSGFYLDLIEAWASSNPEVDRTFKISCDFVGQEIFACAREEDDVSLFDDGLSLKLCNSQGCSDPGQLMLLTGGDKDTSPLHRSSHNATDISTWSKMSVYKTWFTGGVYEVACVQAIDGINVFACTL
jgi:hypothetical protein